ncbi:ATP-binding protein [Litorilituus lipolyticus]|uniref:histidine kinase n=1 Tax=Litorilituus lipolyticus TaxID=2491017 RepID=A0A502KKS0_9GAMM|nr:ATP-binding protein [Litorilituus lipolyticus]TPH12188.1 response regulator [Litorilituus lipolyticus]
MFNQATKNTVFRRYNIAVVVAFIAIILIALSLATLRYYNELSQHKADDLQSLKSEAEQLNTILTQSVFAIDGIQEFAQYTLESPQHVNPPFPQLAQDGKFFYLDKAKYDVIQRGRRLSANITGFGQVEEFSELKKREIAMANALTPAFISAQKIIEQATWFYYVSYQQFVNLYPWVDRDIWQYNNEMLTNPHNTALRQLTEYNNHIVWSPPYLDSAGSGMNASLGKGVFYRGKLLGSVVIDINLARLHQSLPTLNQANQGYVLYNQNNHIFLYKRLGKGPLTYRASWQELLPESLSELSATSLEQSGDSVRFGDWFIEKQPLAVNGWILLKYQDYDDFTQPLRSRFIFIFALLFIGLLAFLMLVNAMTRRTFIAPTTEFIRHIEYCAQGDPGKIKPSSDWLHWFQVVEDIFTQNRSLLLQLREQNDVLDTRVIEKTMALQETSAKHQRDYVLLRSVMNAIPELIVFNDPQGLMIGCNQAFERIAKHQEQQMLGKKAVIFMPKALAAEINYLNANFEEQYPQQALIEAGAYIYQGFCNQFINEHDEVLGTITILRDVTKQHATQTALEKAKDQAEYANKVKIQFLANMSHEIRTPINAMQGMMDLLLTTSLNTRQHHYLTNAQTASVTLLHLVNELLDLSKIEAGKMVISKEPVNLAQVIDKALKLNVVNVDHQRVELLVEVSPDVPNDVFSDEMRLVQVIANLFNNAIKFTEQGSISLTVDNIGKGEDNVLVRFRMKDTGIGIAKDKQGLLFKAFSQADESMTRKYGGSGLGLSICQQIIKLLGGEISLKSALGEGSELSFVLPFKLANSEIKPEPQEVSICNLKQKLTNSFIDTIIDSGAKYYYFDSVEAFLQQSIQEPIVLLVDEKIFELENALLTVCYDRISLLALCHEAMAELSQDTSHHIAQLSMPYTLLDLPLYRFTLSQIYAVLDDNSKHEQNIYEPNLLGKNIDKVIPDDDKSTATMGEELSGVRILLVEDNLVNQLVAKELLLNMHAEVTIADNGQRALDLLAQQSFDIVLMDIQMPIMDGLTATKKIREQACYQTLPIIAMTAHARNEDIKNSLDVGMNLHMSKPVTRESLCQSILQLLEK